MSHDYLPYIDATPTAEQIASARRLLASELAKEDTTTLHPSIQGGYEPQFSELLQKSFTTIAETGKPRVEGIGIDLSRYEEPSAPDLSADRRHWHGPLKAAYTSESYLSQRQLNLSLLEKYGKNAWLIANSQVEDELKTLERELEVAQQEAEMQERGRKRNQEAARGELEGLEETWKSTVGRAIETEVATEALRIQILDKRRIGGGVAR